MRIHRARHTAARALVVWTAPSSSTSPATRPSCESARPPMTPAPVPLIAQALIVIVILTVGVVLIPLLSPALATAQPRRTDGSVEGVVIDRQTRRPVGSAAVLVDGTTLNAVVDDNGRFTVTQVPSGVRVLRVEAAGYVPLVYPEVLVSPGRATTVSLELIPLPPDAARDSTGDPQLRESVTVTGAIAAPPPGTVTTSYGLAYEEVRRSAGSLGDISRFVQALPGVASPYGDLTNSLVVRGGSPNENLTLVDGFEVPNLNHFAAYGTTGGPISMLNNELLADATFLAGGFPAEHGNKLSSVLDVRLREGNRERFELEADLSFGGASVIAEGPLGSRGSWIGSMRRSFVELIAEAADLGDNVPKMSAYTFKGQYDLDRRNKIWMVALGGIDSIDFTVDEADLDDPSLESAEFRGWRTTTGVAWQRLFGERAYGVLSISDSAGGRRGEVRDRQLDDRTIFLNDSSDGETTVRYDLSWQVADGWQVKGGGGWKRLRMGLRMSQPLGMQTPYSIDPARVDAIELDTDASAQIGTAFAQVSGRVLPRTTLTFGARMDRFERIEATRVGPRVGVDVQVSPVVRIGVSGGRYFQQPELLAITAHPQNERLEPIEADHGVAGVYYQPRPDLKMSAELFVKRYRKYPVSIEYPALTLANNGGDFDDSALLLPLESRGRGRSQGLELYMRKTLTGGVYGQASYTFSQTEHAALDGIFRRGLFDTPHVLTLLGGTRLERWEFSGRFTFASGHPYTPPLLPASVEQNRWIYDLSQIHAERLPAYHRLDLRVDRRFRPGRTQMTLFVEVQNVYNRKGAIGYEWNPKTRAIHTSEQLALLPIVGLNVEF